VRAEGAAVVDGGDGQFAVFPSQGFDRNLHFSRSWDAWLEPDDRVVEPDGNAGQAERIERVHVDLQLQIAFDGLSPKAGLNHYVPRRRVFSVFFSIGPVELSGYGDIWP
jgi:hypothetical protein